MLEQLSYRPSMTIYVAVSTSEEQAKVGGNCIPLTVPALKSKLVWGAIRTIRRTIKEKKIDIVFSPSSSGLSNGLFASIGLKVKNVAYRGTQAKVRKGDPTYYLGILNPRVSYVICETEDIRTSLSPFFRPDQMSVRSKPFDVEWMEDACLHPKQADGVSDDAFSLIYIAATKGRPFKGLTSLIHAVNLVDDAKLHFVFIGDYEDSDYQLATNGPAKDRIHFLGHRSDAIYFIPKQNLFVLPSVRDASPRVIREAMACGLPCIVTNIPGAKELIVDDVTGILVPPSDSEKMAEAIVELMNDKAKCLRLGKAGRQRIIDDFSMENYVDYFEQAFSFIAKK